MLDPRPDNAAEGRAKIAMEVAQLARQFRAKYGVNPDRVRIAYLRDAYLGEPLFQRGDEIAGCIVERNPETSYAMEVGLWEGVW